MRGGGRAKFGKKSRTGGNNENKANVQGVPYTFDQDCRLCFFIIIKANLNVKDNERLLKLNLYMAV